MRYGLGKVEESVELWFSDNQTDHVKVSVKVEKQLFGEQTCLNPGNSADF